MTDSSPIIQTSKVSIHQGKMLVLRDVSFSVHPGEFVYVIGKTGSGKSSLLKMLYGDVPLADGEAAVAGFHLNQLKSKNLPQLRRKVGIVFQDFQLLADRTVDDNLRFVLQATGWKGKSKMDYRINEVLDWVGLKTKGFKFPWELSGGEQQRIVLARALLNEPQLILADEPTGNLDPETSIEILKLMRTISEAGTAVLMATHEHNFLSSFPARTLRVKDGYVHEDPGN
jgi:cell division transport system ATP-binding protein